MAERRLLVMDDEPDFCAFVREVAEELGYAVRATGRPAEFEAAYRAFRPTVVVLDIVMPYIDGIELVQWLAREATAAKVIVVTGFNPSYARAAKTLAELKGLTAVETLAKPVAVADLRAALA